MILSLNAISRSDLAGKRSITVGKKFDTKHSDRVMNVLVLDESILHNNTIPLKKWCANYGVRFPLLVIHQDAELESRQNLTEVDIDEILEAQRLQQEDKQKEKKKKESILRARGINPLEHGEDTLHE